MNVARVFRYAAALACALAGAYMALFAMLMLALTLLGGMSALANGPAAITPGTLLSGVVALVRFAGPTTLIAVVLLLAAYFLLPSNAMKGWAGTQ
ncbi:MAG TPA: hypothetical protein VF898_00800 [Chloroflexota bacterium]